MLIEVLYTPGCPNHEVALERIRKLLQSESLEATIHEIAVTEEASARRLRFPGSPTVRVNGLDVEEEPERSVLACRLYPGGEGLPFEGTLRRAFVAAQGETMR